MADAFGAPVIVDSALRDGSLRQAASERGVPVMVFEAGEALRFDEFAIRVGVKGTLAVMTDLGMIRRGKVNTDGVTSPVSRKSTWLRAPEGGVLRIHCKVGDTIRKNDLLGLVSDPFGERETEIRAVHGGLIIGRANLPVVNQGDALFHIATLSKKVEPGSTAEAIEEEFEGDPLFDEDEII